jgi:hypothetical protein
MSLQLNGTGGLGVGLVVRWEIGAELVGWGGVVGAVCGGGVVEMVVVEVVVVSCEVSSPITSVDFAEFNPERSTKFLEIVSL